METYEFQVKFSEDEFDGKGGIRADRLFRYFQDVSEGDVNARGCGPDDLRQQNRIWVLSKMNIFLDGAVEPGRLYTCATFAVWKKSVTFKRDYYIKDEEGTVLVRGAAQWVVLDFDTRRPVKTDLEFPFASEDEEMVPGRFQKIHGADPKLIGEHIVEECDIDFNDHTNNSSYIALSEELTGENAGNDIYVYFVDETRLGDKILVYSEKQTDDAGMTFTYVEGRKESGSVIYQILFR